MSRLGQCWSGSLISRRVVIGGAIASSVGLAGSPLLVRSVTEDEIDEAEQDKAAVEADKVATEALLAAASIREGALQQQLATIDRDRYLAVERLRHVVRELEIVELDLLDITQAIGQTNATLANETAVIERKARSLYKAGRTSLLETALVSNSFAEALARAASLERLLARGIADIDRLRASRREVQLRTADFTARLARAQELRAEAALIKVEIDQRADEQRDIIFSVQKKQDDLSKQEEAFAAESAAMSYLIAILKDIRKKELEELELQARIAEAQAAAQKLAREAASQQAVQGVEVGDYVWPLIGLITTEYGGCTFGQCPHWGMDIAADAGTPVVAANDGLVLASGLVVPGDPRASYGMIVVVAHSGSEETLYAHLDDLTWPPPVRPGQFVSRGQTIGFVGMTGWTTGPHLHLEYRANGFAQNPRDVLP